MVVGSDYSVVNLPGKINTNYRLKPTSSVSKVELKQVSSKYKIHDGPKSKELLDSNKKFLQEHYDLGKHIDEYA